MTASHPQSSGAPLDSSVFDAIASPVLVVNKSGDIAHLNDTCADQLDLSRNHTEGAPAESVIQWHEGVQSVETNQGEKIGHVKSDSGQIHPVRATTAALPQGTCITVDEIGPQVYAQTDSDLGVTVVASDGEIVHQTPAGKKHLPPDGFESHLEAPPTDQKEVRTIAHQLHTESNEGRGDTHPPYRAQLLSTSFATTVLTDGFSGSLGEEEQGKGRSTPTGVVDRNGKIITCNAEFLEAIGASRDAVINQYLWETEAWEVYFGGVTDKETVRSALDEGEPHTHSASPLVAEPLSSETHVELQPLNPSGQNQTDYWMLTVGGSDKCQTTTHRRGEDRSELVTEICDRLSTTATRQEIAAVTTDVIAEKSDANGGWVSEIVLERNELVTQSTTGEPLPDARTIRTGDNKNVIDEAILAKVPVCERLSRDPAAVPEGQEFLRGATEAWPGTNLLCVPLMYGTESAGLLCVAFDSHMRVSGDRVATWAQVGQAVVSQAHQLQYDNVLKDNRIQEATIEIDVPPHLKDLPPEATIAVENRISTPIGGERWFGELRGISPEEYTELIRQADVTDGFKITDSTKRSEDTWVVEGQLSEGYVTKLNELPGVVIKGVTVEQSGAIFTFRMRPGRTLADIIDTVNNLLPPDADEPTLKRKETHTEDNPGAAYRLGIEDELSAKQLETLRVLAGLRYFDPETDVSLEDATEKLGLSDSTVSEHKRKGLQAVMDSLFVSSTVPELVQLYESDE